MNEKTQVLGNWCGAFRFENMQWESNHFPRCTVLKIFCQKSISRYSLGRSSQGLLQTQPSAGTLEVACVETAVLSKVGIEQRAFSC